MSAMTRRSALTGATAAVAVATVAAPVAAVADDAVLLTRIEQFHGVYDMWQDVWEKHLAHRASVEAMPDCPQVPFYRDRTAFLEAHDAYRGWDESNRLGEQSGALARAIFETPAETVRGVLEKVRLLHIARGDYDDDGNGDTDLEVHQDAKSSPWFGAVIADLERLAGEG